MDLRKLKTLIDLVSESNVSELEITEAEGKVRIVKSEGAVVQHYVAAPMQAPMAAPVAALMAPSFKAAVLPSLTDWAANARHSSSSFLNSSNDFPSRGMMVMVGPVGADTQAVSAPMPMLLIRMN